MTEHENKWGRAIRHVKVYSAIKTNCRKSTWSLLPPCKVLIPPKQYFLFLQYPSVYNNSLKAYKETISTLCDTVTKAGRGAEGLRVGHQELKLLMMFYFLI